MLFGRLRETVGDAAETLRRVFQAPPARTLELGMQAQPATLDLASKARSAAFDFTMKADPGGETLFAPPIVASPPVSWQTRIEEERAWERWTAGTPAAAVPVFAAGRTALLEIPPLPKRPRIRTAVLEAFRCRACRILEPLRSPIPRPAAFRLPSLRTRPDLDLALGLPVALLGQDPKTLPKALWMRYTLQLVKETGENIRNLEVLGIYTLPERGVEELRHDATSGRLRVRLTREASGARRRPFLLARRKEDQSLVSCYLEPG